jgi:ethanolamine transporter
MTGAFPLVYLLAKILNRPLSLLGKKIGLDHQAILGFIASGASFATCTPLIPKMNKKGRMANLAFAVSGAFTFAGHLAFTLSVNPDFVTAVVVGKLVAGITAVAVALLVYKKLFGNSNVSADN